MTFYRQKFVTNSSNTSFVAFGICIDRAQLRKIEEELPECVRDYYEPSGDYVYLTIGFPTIKIDEDGMLEYPSADCMQKDYTALKEWAQRNGVTDKIGYLCEGWYDG